MKKPTLSIIIPTAGGGDLPLTIHSINTQGLIDGDQILVIGDGPQHEAQDQIEALGEPYRFLSCQQTGDWGHTPCNFALPFCTADYLLVQGDDDIFLPRAFDKIREAILANTGEPRPLMFRFYTNDRWLVWADEDTHELGPALVGDHNIIAPNILNKLGRWETHYRGDLGYVRGTAGFYGGSAGMLWRKEIITRQRPSISLFDWPVREGEKNAGHYAVLTSEGHNLCSVKGNAGTMAQYIFTQRDNPTENPIAASEYSLANDLFWASIWLSNEHFGKGFGRELVQHAIDAAHGDCWMSVEKKDASIIHLLNEFGFSQNRIEEGRILMVRKFPP